MPLLRKEIGRMAENHEETTMTLKEIEGFVHGAAAPERRPCPQSAERQTLNMQSIVATLQGIERLTMNVESIASATERSAEEIREMHRLYHNEFAGRLKSKSCQIFLPK
jgi:hypothetical protein